MDLMRTRAIVQYIQPFSSVDLATMSKSLGMSQDMLLMELEQLVEKGKIKGRIDLIDQVCPLIPTHPQKEKLTIRYYTSKHRTLGRTHTDPLWTSGNQSLLPRGLLSFA
jgi:hypothetical protein